MKQTPTIDNAIDACFMRQAELRFKREARELGLKYEHSQVYELALPDYELLRKEYDRRTQ